MSDNKHQATVNQLSKALSEYLLYPIHFQKDRNKSNTTRSHSSSSSPLGWPSLKAIMHIDPIQKIAVVEPGVTFEKLCIETLKMNLLPCVVPEFKTITIGGAIMGAALESSSWHYGQFSDTCIEYEVLLANGTQLKVNKEQYPDLFYGLSGSYGTIALLTLVTLQLTDATPFVTIKINSHKSFLEAKEDLLKASSNTVEAIGFEKNWTVLHGSFTDTKVKNHFRPHLGSPWFYQFVQSQHKAIFSMNTIDYLFRYDRGAFWMGAYLNHAKVIMTYLFKGNKMVTKKFKALWLPLPTQKPPNLPFRLFFHRQLSCQKLYRALHSVKSEDLAHLFVIQDFYIPIDQAAHVINYIQQELYLAPLWLCPIKTTATPQLLSPHYQPGSQLLNIGVYGKPHKQVDPKQATIALEKLCIALKGRKMLYSQCFFKKEDFWTLYDRGAYQELRGKYGADQRLPTIEEKLLIN